MTPMILRGSARVALALAAVAVFATVSAAQRATTTASVRGVVTGPDGAPIAGVTVLATNTETGVRRGGNTDDAGRYSILFLEPGPYTFRAQRIGYRPVEKPGYRMSIGQLEQIDFQLEPAPTQLTEQKIVAEAIPLIEPHKTGSNTRIGEVQIAQLPTNGRNFKDLVNLAPGVADKPNSGSGGGQSIGGGRTGASNILMDGVNNNESFFGGDARGGDRAPFSYSIEVVKEIQVISAGYDVEQGAYTGGAVNAVTKSGTNDYTGSLFSYLRQDKALGMKLTNNDFLGRKPVDFKSQQYGFTFGGPIIKDKAHFLVALDRQVRGEPRPLFPSSSTSDTYVRQSGMNPDTLAVLLATAKNLYGYDGSKEVGQFLQNTDESAFFGRLDWQLNDQHHITLRDNYTNTKLSQDRAFVSPTSTDFVSNAGDNTDKQNSFVGSMTSLFGKLSNEFRMQYATDNKPRPSNPAGGYGVPLPQVIVRGITSVLSDNSRTTTEVRFGADPVLHSNLLDEKTTEIIDNLRYSRGNHNFKLGTNFTHINVLNRFWNNALGTWTFNSLLDFENANPLSFTRFVPSAPGLPLPLAQYKVNEWALYAQDEWQVSPRLFVSYGVRYDYSWFPADVAPNPLFSQAFPYLDITKQPVDNNNMSPRVGFTFDPRADGRQVIRGGSGIFFGRTPYVLWSNALLNTGQGSSTLSCTAAGTVPIPDFASYAADPSTIPTACIGAGAAPAAPSMNVFDRKYQQAYAWKSNLAYDRLIIDGWKVGVEGVFSTVRDNYLVQDDNLQTVPQFFIEGKIPVFVPASTINTGNGAVSAANSRLNNNFFNVYVHRSLGSTLSRQMIFTVDGRPSWGFIRFSYTNDHTLDNASIPCCITGTMFTNSRTAANPNNYNDQWGQSDFSRRHQFVVAPTAVLKWGFQLGATFRAFSGVPWTPRYNFDINGDGAANDRLYIPTRAEVATYEFAGANAEEQSRNRGLFEQRIESVKCLRQHRGQIAPRDSCENPWQYLFDARISKKFDAVRGQSVELVADFFNVLNGLNKNWGRRMAVDDGSSGSGGSGTSALVPSGFNTVTNKYRYVANPAFGKPTIADTFSSNQFQVQLGLRYNF
jgi:hypothetical protein